MLKIFNFVLTISFALTTNITKADELDLSKTLDITHYEFNYDIPLKNTGNGVADNRLSATASITFTNTGDKAITSIPLILNRLMTITKATNGKNEDLSFSQNLKELKNFDLFQANIIQVTLSKPLLKGQTTKLSLNYSGALAGATETGMSYVRETLDPTFTILRSEALAYPQISYPDWLSLRSRWNDDFDWKATFTLPKTHKVATGHLVNNNIIGDKNIVTISSILPQSMPYFPIAPYTEVIKGNNRIFALPGNKEGRERISKYMDKTLVLYKEWFGKMPSNQGFAIAEIPEKFGSQALLPTIIQTSDAFNDMAGLNQLFHEMSHLWNLDDNNAQSPRLNEGLASFLQYYTAEKFGQKGIFDDRMDVLFARVKNNFSNGRYGKKIPMEKYGDEHVTGMSYNVGPLFYLVLFDRLGHDQFMSILKSYYVDNHGGDASLKSMASYYKSKATVKVEDIFNDWLFTNNYVAKFEKAKGLEDLRAEYE